MQGHISIKQSTHLQHIPQLMEQLPLMVVEGVGGEPKLALVSDAVNWHLVFQNEVAHVIARIPVGQAVMQYHSDRQVKIFEGLYPNREENSGGVDYLEGKLLDLYWSPSMVHLCLFIIIAYFNKDHLQWVDMPLQHCTFIICHQVHFINPSLNIVVLVLIIPQTPFNLFQSITLKAQVLTSSFHLVIPSSLCLVIGLAPFFWYVKQFNQAFCN